MAIAVICADLVRFGTRDSYAQAGAQQIPYLLITPLIAIGWFITLRIIQAADERVIADGAETYTRVLHSTFIVFGLISITSVLTETDLSRGYLFVALSLGLTLLFLTRWFWRRRLWRSYIKGRCERRVIAVGSSTLSELLNTVVSNRTTPWRIVGLCTTGAAEELQQLPGVTSSTPTVSSWRDIKHLAERTGADTVAIAGAYTIGLQGMRELSWDLEELNVDILVAPGIIDVAGPRMMMRPVAGIPLIHVDKPRYRGASRLGKLLLDKIGAFLLILLFSPLLLICALGVKLTSRGPVFYVAERLGMNNEPFGMIKFRSMVVDADKMKDKLREQNESDGGVLFKMKDDPRITPFGKFLRRFSLDELPQLFNVLGGSMSLVGPRPPLREEVMQYDPFVARRMLVRPGMTGLWQVSGRSNLSWEQSVRLDLSYVENWSLLEDIHILWSTLRAVLSRDGAY
ncbi:sugar transferase [Corynebacterium sp. TAE3-ERU30]|nr:sugar transferase [Corynebacterium sp. TAE3-ERU30]MBV7301761.1 sugar transferase [Corynebacterium sp. TAE3-ERU2]